jgi:hypothetical protein
MPLHFKDANLGASYNNSHLRTVSVVGSHPLNAKECLQCESRVFFLRCYIVQPIFEHHQHGAYKYVKFNISLDSTEVHQIRCADFAQLAKRISGLKMSGGL